MYFLKVIFVHEPRNSLQPFFTR